MEQHNSRFWGFFLLPKESNRKHLRIPEFWVVDKRMVGSVADRILCRLVQQKLLEFLLDLCASHRTCETKRQKPKGLGLP